MTLRNLGGNSVGSRECGKIRIGYLVLVLFLAVFGYLSYRIVPVYTQQDAFDEDLLDLAGTATRKGWDNGEIVNQVRKLGKTRSVQIFGQAAKVYRHAHRGTGMRAIVPWRRWPFVVLAYFQNGIWKRKRPRSAL